MLPSDELVKHYTDKAQKAPIKEFHLTEEAIRSNALRCAIENSKVLISRDINPSEVVETAKQFEEYIRNGN